MAKKKQTIRRFLLDAVLSDNPTSSKRLVTLLVTGHFLLASFLVLFLATYMVFFQPKGKLDVTLAQLLEQILEYDFYIILSGLGFIAAENVATMFIERAKAKFSNLFSSSSTFTATQDINKIGGTANKEEANEDVKDT